MPRTKAATTTSWQATSRSFSLRQRPLAGAVVAFGLVLGACTASSAGGPAPTGPAASPQTTTSSADSPDLDAGLAELRAALERYEAGYEYVSEAWVGGERAIRVEGRRVGNATYQTITSGDGAVEFLAVGGDEWARTPGEDWEIVTEDGAVRDPLGRLASPASVIGTVATATRTELDAAYPGDTFGLDDDELIIHLVLQDFQLVSASYETGDGAQRAMVETTFGPLEDSTPITAP